MHDENTSLGSKCSADRCSGHFAHPHIRSGRYRNIDYNRTAAAAGVCTTRLPRAELYLDSWLLGLGAIRLLLGSWYMGDGSSRWPALDARLLGLVGWHLCMERRVLGA